MLLCSELGYLLRDLGERLSSEEMSAHFKSMDRNNDSVVDFDEFVYGMERYIRVRERGALLFPAPVFRAFIARLCAPVCVRACVCMWACGLWFLCECCAEPCCGSVGCAPVHLSCYTCVSLRPRISLPVIVFAYPRVSTCRSGFGQTAASPLLAGSAGAESKAIQRAGRAYHVSCLLFQSPASHDWLASLQQAAPSPSTSHHRRM